MEVKITFKKRTVDNTIPIQKDSLPDINIINEFEDSPKISRSFLKNYRNAKNIPSNHKKLKKILALLPTVPAVEVVPPVQI